RARGSRRRSSRSIRGGAKPSFRCAPSRKTPKRRLTRSTARASPRLRSSARSAIFWPTPRRGELTKPRVLALLFFFLLGGCKPVESEPSPPPDASASAAPSSSAAPAASVPLKKAEKAPPGTIRFAVIGDYGADTPDEGRVA